MAANINSANLQRITLSQHITGHSYKTITGCRACHSTALQDLFSLGQQYVSDFVDTPNTNGHLCPIDIILCQYCTLVQAKHTAPQELLYARHYWYRSGVTDTMRAALKDVTDAAQKMVPLDPGDIVLDIGSNDGTLLRTYENPDIVKVGVEPATNLAEEGAQGVDHFINDFWTIQSYVDEFHGLRKAKIITACGMFYDLDDPNQFIQDISLALHTDGVFVAQLMCLKNMINACDLGNLAHEHLEYYTLKSLQKLLEKYDLEIFDIETNKVNGESYRLFIRKSWPSKGGPISGRGFLRLEEALRQEENLLDETIKFFSQMEVNKRNVVGMIKSAASQGKQVWVYGASTKGNVILQYYGLDHTLISGAADRSPEKWGKFTIGTGIPIKSEEEGRKSADYFLVLPYAFLPEFMEREQAWRNRGGKFIVPLPNLKVV